MGCQTGQSLVKTTLNMTGFSNGGNAKALGVTFNSTGSCIIGQTGGTPVIDALSSRFINWEHLCIYGSSFNEPSVGLQIGRISSAAADDMYFNRPVITGNFTFTPFYNFASETLVLVHPFFSNADSGAGTYSYVGDGYNHWNITSAFVTQTAPVDTFQSFNKTTVLEGVFLETSGAGGSAMWLGGGRGHRYLGTYLVTNNNLCGVLFEETTVANSLYLDVHCESAGTFTTGLQVQTSAGTGQITTPTISSFTYINNAENANTSVLGLASPVTAVTLINPAIQIDQYNNAATMFDTPANWNIDVSLGTVPSFKQSMTGKNNTAMGSGALGSATSGNANTAFGANALGAQTTTIDATAVGSSALPNSTGVNDALGQAAGQFISTGTFNVAVGQLSMQGATGARTTGNDNTALGNKSLQTCQGACNNNLGLGFQAGSSITTGSANTVVGPGVASTTLTTGTDNILIGNSNAIDTSAATDSHTFHLGGSGGDIISATGLNNPSASVVTFPGSLALGTPLALAYVAPIAANSFLCNPTGSTAAVQPCSVPPLIPSGATFSLSGCSNDTHHGGVNTAALVGAGRFVCRATGSVTLVFTLPSAGATGSGWTGPMSDETTPSAFTPTGHSATSLTFTGTVVTGDIISFGPLTAYGP